MTDTTDIVARLRELANTLSGAAYNADPWGHLVRDPSAEMLRVAASRIEALEAEVAKLRGALGEIEGGHIPGMASLVLAYDWHAVVNLFQARARAALGGGA